MLWPISKRRRECSKSKEQRKEDFDIHFKIIRNQFIVKYKFHEIFTYYNLALYEVVSSQSPAPLVLSIALIRAFAAFRAIILVEFIVL